MEVKLGLRVVRGPDWERGNEDGGEGYVGTVVAGGRAEDGRHDVATVQWDVGGERRVYRCGAEGKYDLRVIDSAPAGVVHRHWECSGCGSESIAGCVWRCVHCLRYYLCTPCYMKDRHSVWHHFMRIDSPENPRQRTRVQCRYQSSRVVARGVFVGARVVRGRDWKWGDQDGGVGREGTVVEMCGWQSESSRSVAVVEWRESCLKKKYRLGHKGKVDLQCTVAAEGGHCYLDHLPQLGSEYKPDRKPFLAAGDRVLVDTSYQSSSATVVEFAGKVGVLDHVGIDGGDVNLTVGTEVGTSSGVLIEDISKVSKKVEGPDILPDDVVRVIDDMAEVHRLQKEGRGWHDDMALSLGQLGRVERLLDDGSVAVVVNGRRWILDPRCLVPVPGEQPQDEGSEEEPGLDFDFLMLTIVRKEPTPESLRSAAARGNVKFLTETLTKWPEMQVHVKQNGMSLLYVAAVNGRVNVTKLLLEHKADMTALGNVGETPLHGACYFNHYYVVKLLLDKGCDVNVRDNRGDTPLHVATTLGFSRLVALLLSQPNCQINPRNGRGNTPLYISSQTFRPAISRQLLEAGADISMICMLGYNALGFATTKEYFLAVQMYVEHDHRLINQIKVDDGTTPLHVAANLDHCDILCYLAATETCELDKKAYNGWSPLHTACAEGNIRSIECLVGYGADPRTTDLDGTTPLHFVLAMQNMKPLSEWTPHLNKFHEYVSGADNSIQDVPVYITVACFLISEGASLETKSVNGFFPHTVCPHEYHSLLKLFARPERRGNYRGSLPRHPPPDPRHSQEQISSLGTSTGSPDKATPSKTKATPTKTETRPTKTDATPTKTETTPTKPEATPPEVSVSGGDSNKREESEEVDSATGPSCFLCEGPCDISFQPCGHTAMCSECAGSVKRCPTCQINIQTKIKITL